MEIFIDALMISIMVLATAWVISLFAANQYPAGYSYNYRPVYPFWFHIGSAAIFDGVMFQLHWEHGLSPYLVLVPIGVAIVVTYRLLNRRSIEESSARRS